MSETYPGFKTRQWCGIHAKAGTPTEIVLGLQREVAKALHAPDVVAKHEAESDCGRRIALEAEGLSRRGDRAQRRGS